MTTIRNERMASRIKTIEDARRFAHRRLPRMVFDFIDGGAEAETTMRANRAAFEGVGFAPKMAVPELNVAPTLSTTVLGTQVAMPILVAPVGGARVIGPGGDAAGARATRAAGTIFVMSTMSGNTQEEVVAAADGPVWFQ